MLFFFITLFKNNQNITKSDIELSQKVNNFQNSGLYQSIV